MTYLIIFNNHRGVIKEQIRVSNFLEFLEQLSGLVQRYSEPPDLIYLMSIK